MHILAIFLWLVAPADAPLRLYPTAPPPPAVAAAPYKSRRAKTPSPTPTPLHSHAALRKPTAKSNPNPEPVGSGRRSRERAPRGSRESRGGRDHGAGDLAATPSSRRRFPRRNRRRSFAAAGAAPRRWPMQVETAAVRLPFSVGAGFRLPVAVSGGTVFAVWYYDTAAKPVVNLPLLFRITDALDSRGLVHRFPWQKKKLSCVTMLHHLSFLRKGTCCGFDWTPRDGACSFHQSCLAY
jgi:hypothetical protein